MIFHERLFCGQKVNRWHSGLKPSGSIRPFLWPINGPLKPRQILLMHLYEWWLFIWCEISSCSRVFTNGQLFYKPVTIIRNHQKFWFRSQSSIRNGQFLLCFFLWNVTLRRKWPEEVFYRPQFFYTNLRFINDQKFFNDTVWLFSFSSWVIKILKRYFCMLSASCSFL